MARHIKITPEERKAADKERKRLKRLDPQWRERERERERRRLLDPEYCKQEAARARKRWEKIKLDPEALARERQRNRERMRNCGSIRSSARPCARPIESTDGAKKPSAAI
jgi:hypothetical protein